MCVGFWTLEHPDYALILCTNRDEYLSRPTTTAYWHSFEVPINEKDIAEESNNSSNKGSVLSGRDLRAGGTWLGINRHGDVAFLTNITETVQHLNSTRGELTSSFLLSDVRPQDLQTYCDEVTAHNSQYAGFNLLLLAPRPLNPSLSHSGGGGGGGGGITAPEGRHDSTHLVNDASYASSPSSTTNPATTWWTYDAAHLTNHGGGGDLASRPLTDTERRYGALSNGIDGLDANEWPKVQQGLEMFEDVLDKHIRGRNIVRSSTSRTSQKTAETERVRDGSDDYHCHDGDLPITEPDLVERLFHLLTWKNPIAPTITRNDLRNTILIDPLHVSPDPCAPPSSEEAEEEESTTTTTTTTTTTCYGTRLSTVILVRRDGSALFIERDVWKFDSEGQIKKGDWPKEDRVHRFQLATR